MIDPSPHRIVYCYFEYQQFSHRGLPDLEDFDGTQSVLLIIHDLMNEADETVANLFTKDSQKRKRGISGAEPIS